MTHSLVEISRDQWPALRDLYAGVKTYSGGFFLIQNFIDWTKQDPSFDVVMYSLDGDWQDGTFLLEAHSQIFCNTLNEKLDRLRSALNCLDAKKGYVMGGFQERLLPAIRDHFVHSGLSAEDFQPDDTYWHHIPQDKALNFDVVAPEGIILGPLRVDDADQINNVWPHRSPGSVKFVEFLIRFNDSVGARDSEGNLVGWCLRLPLGALGILQVLESHRRRGLGSLMVRYMAKTLAAKDAEVLAPVVCKNVASLAMFKGQGFNIIDKVYWAMKPHKQY